MKWISKKKEQLQEEQAEEAKNAAAGGYIKLTASPESKLLVS
jgi:hypothetical protein